MAGGAKREDTWILISIDLGLLNSFQLAERENSNFNPAHPTKVLLIDSYCLDLKGGGDNKGEHKNRK